MVVNYYFDVPIIILWGTLNWTTLSHTRGPHVYITRFGLNDGILNICSITSIWQKHKLDQNWFRNVNASPTDTENNCILF